VIIPLISQLHAAGLPEPEVEFKFDAKRGWRFDFAWPDAKVAVEVEGGTQLQGGGRHNRAQGYEKDCEKYNAAAIAGWLVLRFTTRQVANGKALSYITLAFEVKSHEGSEL
jgi:very-short-patch-repair endonuclease